MKVVLILVGSAVVATVIVIGLGMLGIYSLTKDIEKEIGTHGRYFD